MNCMIYYCDTELPKVWAMGCLYSLP